MTDTTTQKKLTVRDGDVAGPYIWVSLAQLESAKAVLRSHEIGFWVDPESISINGGPSMIVINLGRGPTVDDVQPLFDAVD